MASSPPFLADSELTPPSAAHVLTDELAQLLALVEATRAPLYKLRQGGDTRLIETVLRGLVYAKTHAGAALRELAAGRPGDAIAAVTALIEVLRDQIASRDNLDELDRETGDAAEGSPRARHWSDVERSFEGFGATAGRLAEAIIAFSHDIEPKERADMDDTNESMAQAVRELGNTIAMLGGNGSGAIASRSGRRYEAVADQLAASLDAYGLPHDGGQIVRAGDPETARIRLIDGLKRNFAHREQDGMRLYYQTDAQPVTRDRYDRARLLRGGALVNANLLAAEADAVVAILDRLPSMARFERARGVIGLRALRDTVRTHLDNLVDCARDPMGLNRPRASFEYLRLTIAVFDYLDEAEALPIAAAPKPQSDLDAAIAVLTRFRDEQVTQPVSIVRDEEIRVEIASLLTLLESLGIRLLRPRGSEHRGLAAARLEEIMTAALGATDQLEAALERWGTDLLEQDVQFIPARGGAGETMSIGQFIRWVRAIAAPFARSDMAAAAMRGGEAAVLAEELAALERSARDFERASGGLGLQRASPRAQLAELAGYLAAAGRQAAILAGAAEGKPA